MTAAFLLKSARFQGIYYLILPWKMDYLNPKLAEE